MASPVTAPGEEKEGVGDPRAAVFITTSLGTHLALDVHLHDTVADLKRYIVLAHSTLFPGYKEIKIDGKGLVLFPVRFHARAHDSRRDEGNIFLFVDASVCGEEHLEEKGLMNHTEGLNIEEDNQEDAVKGASSLGTKESDHKETSIEELPLIVPELAVVDDAGQVNGVQQNGRPRRGDSNREFIRDKAIPKAVGAVVCDPSATAGVVADKSSTKKKRSLPKKKIEQETRLSGKEASCKAR